MKMQEKPVFARCNEGIYSEIRKKVDAYLKENQSNGKANGWMILKSCVMLGFLGLSYAYLLSGACLGWLVCFPFLLLGFAVALATLNISHDGLHGAYFTSPKLNRAIGFLMDICGKSSHFWGSEHVNDHHIFTNISGYDYDLNVENPLLRLCPHAPYKKYQRYQHIYAPLLYCFYPLHNQLAETQKAFKLKEVGLKIQILSFRILHYFLFLAVPKMVLGLGWGPLLVGYFCYSGGVGITLSFVFQFAHIVDNVEFPVQGPEGKMEDSFLVHQLKTTADFSRENWLARFLFGGLNFQVEHHLFPHVSHIHLYKLSHIVKAIVKEHGLPYHENPTLLKAIYSHLKTLKKLGSPQPFG